MGAAPYSIGAAGRIRLPPGQQDDRLGHRNSGAASDGPDADGARTLSRPARTGNPGTHGRYDTRMTPNRQMLQQTVSLLPDREAHPARRVGIALVGLGSWAPIVLGVLGDRADADVRWICDLETTRLAKYRHRHPGAHVTTRLARVLADPGVDAIVLATPVDTHYELAMDALEAGKHVFVKAPLATAAELADDLAAVARRRQRIVMSGQTLLYSAAVRAVKGMIETGTIGDIQCI